jgi:dihydroorotate dehydrogenase
MTSSPFLIALSPNFGDVSVANATKLADEPELTVIKAINTIFGWLKTAVMH